jgi:hypothetical protein
MKNLFSLFAPGFEVNQRIALLVAIQDLESSLFAEVAAVY